MSESVKKFRFERGIEGTGAAPCEGESLRETLHFRIVRAIADNEAGMGEGIHAVRLQRPRHEDVETF